MSAVKKLLLVFVAALLALLAVGAGWSLLPPAVDRDDPDRAVHVLNERARGDLTFSEAYFEFENLKLHYVEAGRGAPVVFLHGFPSFWFSLSRQMEHLADEHRVIAIDGLGAGKSDAPRAVASYGLEAMSRHIMALLDDLDIDAAHLIGHDWGSALAIGMAQRYPDRVLSVTGMSAPPLNAILHGLESDSAARDSFRYVEQFKRANPLLLVALDTADTIFHGAYKPLVDDRLLGREEGELFRGATRAPRRINAHINWYRANVPAPGDIMETDFWPGRNARVRAPALYVWGEDDPIYNQATIDRMLALSDDATLLMLPGIGHWPHLREAEQVNAAIGRNLRRASPP